MQKSAHTNYPHTLSKPQSIFSSLPTSRKSFGILEFWNKYIYSSLTTIYMLYIGLVFSPFSIPLVLFLTKKNSNPIPISLNLFQFQPSDSNSKKFLPNYEYFSILSKSPATHPQTYYVKKLCRTPKNCAKGSRTLCKKVIVNTCGINIMCYNTNRSGNNCSPCLTTVSR